MRPWKRTPGLMAASVALPAVATLVAAGFLRWWAPTLAGRARRRPADRALVYVATADMRYLVPVSADLPAGGGLAAAARLVVEWPTDGLLRSPFPEGTRFLSAGAEGSTAVVRVATPAASGEGNTARAAAEALALTLTGLDGVMRVRLDDSRGDGPTGTSSRPAFVNHDGSPPVQSSMKIVSWFGYRGRYLVPYTRFVPRTLEPHRTALEHLVAGPPAGSGLERTVPPGTRVLSVSVKGGTCAVDLSDEMAEVGKSGGTGARIAVESVLLTATEFADVESVDIRIHGRKPQTLGDYEMGGPPLGRPVINPAPGRPN